MGDFASESPSFVGGPAAFGLEPGGGDLLGRSQVEEDKISVVAGGDMAFTLKAVEFGRAHGEHFDDLAERKFAFEGVVDEDGVDGLDAGHPAGGGGVGAGFFFECVGGVVGAEDVEESFLDGFPEGVLGRFFPDWWVHLELGAESLVHRGVEGEVLGRRFTGDGDALGFGFGDEGEFLMGRDVEDVGGASGLGGEGDEASGGADGALGVSGPGVEADVGVFGEFRLALSEAGFVFAVDGHWPSAVEHDLAQGVVVFDEEGAGAAAHEDFDSGDSGEAFESEEVVGVGGGASDEEGVVAPGAAIGAVELVFESLLGGGGGVGVGHFEDGGNASGYSGAGAGFEVFFVG